MPFCRSNSEITLLFDRWNFRPSPQQCELLRSQLRTIEGVTAIQIGTDWLRRQRLTAVFQSHIAPAVMLRKMAVALRGLLQSRSPESNLATNQSEPEPTTPEPDGQPTRLSQSVESRAQRPVQVLASSAKLGWKVRLRQWFYGTLAGAAFGMAWVGLLVPGIPTIPFVLLAAHWGLKSSDKFRDKLLQSRTFGPMMRDWQDHGAIQRTVRTRAYVLVFVLTGVTLLLSPRSPLLYAGIATMTVIGLVLISRIPVLDDNSAK